MVYTPSTSTTTATADRKRVRKRVITWFNPPFDMKVKTNVGRKFRTMVEECFPEGHKLRKIFNKNTLKLSYSCMPNVKRKIDQHNHSLLHGKQNDPKPCVCTNYECPLDKRCRQADIVYQASVTDARNNQTNTETYIGMTALEFPARYANHRLSFRNKKYRSSTKLANHVWKLKDSKCTDYAIRWKVVDRAPAYNNISKKCHLCLLERYYIIYHPEMASLNEAPKLTSKCRHFDKFLLAKHPP